MGCLRPVSATSDLLAGLGLVLTGEAGAPGVAGDLLAQERGNIEGRASGKKKRRGNPQTAAAHKAPQASCAALHPLDELSGATNRLPCEQSFPREPDIRKAN
jgi:hypothetical protein